ncbi:hypothetical protein HQQ80_18445 [Microbacteriaceae bacterium VKM Ac-2855]|nr:hypothetical protein [Microbacteriaceae bacterium VKM Ac-2855]
MFSSLALSSAGVAAHWGGPGVGGFGWLFLFIPLFWLAVFALFFGLMRRRMLRRGWGPGFAGAGYHGFVEDRAVRSAETTLADRFARGDIDEVEYRARLEVLRSNRGSGPQDA